MRLNRPLALALALFTVAPAVYFVVFLAFLMPRLASLSAGAPEDFLKQFDVAMRLHILNMFLVLALLVFYVVHLFHTVRVPTSKKALWAVVLLLGNLFAMPVYWYFYIWQGPVNEPR